MMIDNGCFKVISVPKVKVNRNPLLKREYGTLESWKGGSFQGTHVPGKQKIYLLASTSKDFMDFHGICQFLKKKKHVSALLKPWE